MPGLFGERALCSVYFEGVFEERFYKLYYMRESKSETTSGDNVSLASAKPWTSLSYLRHRKGKERKENELYLSVQSF